MLSASSFHFFKITTSRKLLRHSESQSRPVSTKNFLKKRQAFCYANQPSFPFIFTKNIQRRSKSIRYAEGKSRQLILNQKYPRRPKKFRHAEWQSLANILKQINFDKTENNM